MAVTKLTKVDIYTAIRDYLAQNDCSPEWIDRMDKDIELASKKKSTAETQEHIAIMAEIVSAIQRVGKPACISDMKSVSDILSPMNPQKISAMCSKLIAKGEIKKSTVKKVTYFALAGETND